MTKAEEHADPKSCLNKTANDERIFILRALDLVAASTVKFLAYVASDLDVADEKILEALSMAAMMESWPNRRLPD